MISKLEKTIWIAVFVDLDRHYTILGSGGIWRIGAIDEAGGWNDRTTVEDMDLALRAGLMGWKFVFLGDVLVNSRL